MISTLLPWLVSSSTFVSMACAQPVFYKDVLPILQQHCQECHRPGEIAPMPFLTYAETRPWAKAIREQTVARKMPPWFADPMYGHFANDRSLSHAEIDTLAAWVNAARPQAIQTMLHLRANGRKAGISESRTKYSKCPRPFGFLRRAPSIISI